MIGPRRLFDGRTPVFDAASKHIGMYPIDDLDAALEAEAAPYRATKDTLHFPDAKPFPYGLIGRIVVARWNSL